MSALLNTTVGNATVVSEVDNTEYYREPEYDNYVYPDPEEEEEKTQQKKLCSVALHVMELTKNVADTLLRQVSVGEKEMHLHTKEIGMWIKKVDRSSYERSSLGLNENNQIILPAKTNINFSSVQNVIHIKFFHSKLNPFLCHESSRYINTHTVLFSLQDESKNEVPLISEEVTNLETFIKRKDRAAQRVKGIALIQNTSSLTDDDIMLHKFVVTQEYVSLQIVIHPKKKDEQFLVVIKFQSQPVIKDFSNASLIVPFTNARKTTQYVLTVPESMLHTSVGIYYLGVLPYVDVVVEQLNLQHSWLQQAPIWEGSSYEKLSQEYTLSVFLSRCLFWNEQEDEWSQTGCQVGPRTTETNIHCMCSHLSVFAASFLVTPNTIQLRTLPKFLKNMTSNIIIICSVCSVWGIYILFIIWARRKDRKDVLKRAVVVLEDNKPSETYAYLISVYTGMWLNSGTTANVGIQLLGKKMNSRKVLLRDSNMKRMQQGSNDWFLLSTSQSLGGLTGLKVWHDSAGASPSWYLKKILIRDIQTNRAWLFIAERWLDITTEGLHCHLKPASQKEISNFSLKFNDTTIRSFQDINLWSSIFLRPPHSNFTRVQRITCALSLVLTTMVCNTMFYGINVYDTEDQLEILKFSVSLSHVITGLESSLIAFVVNVLIIALFRNVSPCPDLSKKQDQMKSEVNPSLNEESKPVMLQENVSGPSSVTEKIPVITDIQNISGSVSNETTKLHTGNSSSYQWWFGQDKHSIKSAHRSFWENHGNDECSLPQGWFRFVPVVNYLIYGADQKTTKTSGTTEMTTRPCLSWWFIYIIWTLAFLTLVTSSFFIVLYGLTYGYKRSLEWLLSVVTAVFHSLIIIQPLMSVFYSILLAWMVKKPPVLMDRNDNAALERGEVYVSSSVQQMLLRKKENKSEDISAEPLSEEAHEKLKTLWIKQKLILKLIKEVSVYVLFAVATFIAVHGHRSPLAYYGTETAKDVFVRGHYTHSMPLKNVRNFKDVITFINHTLIPSLHMDHRYNKDNINSLGFTVDYVSKLVGVPRLRQLRVKPVLHSGNSDVEDVLGKYSLSYSWNNEDTTDYLIGWKTARNANEIERTAVNPWIWQSSKELSTLPTTGLLAYYSGNGYVTQLGRARPWSWRIFTELVEAGWLDEQTRAIQVEFTTYNVNSNLFCHVTLLFEFAPTGGVFTRSHLNTLRLFLYTTDFEIFVAMCEVMSVIYLIGFAIKEGTDLYKLRLQYFKNFWNLQELSVVLLGFGCVFLYLQRTLEVKNTLKANDAKTGNKFVSFTYVTFWDSTLFYVQAILICLVTTRFWKLLSFSPYMQVPTRTMGKAGTPLLYFVFLLSVVMTGMVFFCYYTFGANVDMMRNFVETFFSLINFSLGRIEFETMNEADRLFGPVFVSFFIIFIMLILLTLFFTILNRALEETLHEALGADIPETKDMLDYLNHQINLIFRKTSISWVEKVYMNEINQNKTL